MPKQQPWFIAERSLAFASLLLTRGDRVAVRASPGHDQRIDLLAELLNGGKPTLRFFGAQLIGYLDLPPIESADEHVHSHPHSMPGLPVCAFVIGVRNLDGLYRWVVEPTVADGRGVLRHQAQPDWRPLDDAGVDRIVTEVSGYYDALSAGATWERPRGRGARTGG